MFQPWRIKLREAGEALRQGRLEEATRLLSEQGLMEFLPAKQLMARIAQQMAHRAEQRFAAGATVGGWRDLEEAERLGAGDHAVARLKQQFIDGGLGEAESYLKAGDPAAAVARLEALERQGAGGREFRLTREAAAKVLAAQRMCLSGGFAQAEEALRAALVLRPGWKVLEDIRRACAERGAMLRKNVEKLHIALSSEDWTIVLVHTEAILEFCPEHVPALDARRRAWAVVGMQLQDAAPAAVVCVQNGRAPLRREATQMLAPNGGNNPALTPTPAPRFLLWIDGVGGYLVCQGDVVTLGQPVHGSYVDVPVLGDISRMHALVRRDGESYLIEPLRLTRVDGRAIDGMTLLCDGSEIELGDGVRMRFRVPNPLSRTARLDFTSRHRTLPTTDGVLLLAESCVLGPGGGAHVTCRNWSHEVVLFPQGDSLHCRTAGRFAVDGIDCEGRAPITSSSQIVGEDFSLSLEKA